MSSVPASSENLKDVLKDVIPHIRLENLTALHLATTVKTSELFEETSVFNLLCKAVIRENGEMNKHPYVHATQIHRHGKAQLQHAHPELNDHEHFFVHFQHQMQPQ